MKLITSILTSILLLILISGCGGTNTSNEMQESVQTTGTEDQNDSAANTHTTEEVDDNVTLAFPTEGTYDLSLYALPLETITQKVYMATLYTNDTNAFDDNYGELNTTTIFFESISTDNDMTTFSSTDLYSFDITVLEDRLQYEDNVSNPIDIVRFAELGSVLAKDLLQLDTTTDTKASCSLSDHFDSYENFSNVIQIDCSSSSNLFFYKGFFAQNLGLVSDIATLCSSSNNCTNLFRKYNILN